MQIVETVLDKNGNLKKKGVIDYKEIKAFTFYQNPFLWTDIIRKNTDNLNEAFVKKLLEDNNISFDTLKETAWWFPYYFLSFLMEISTIIRNKGIKDLKRFLHKTLKAKDMIDKISDKIDLDTSLEDLSRNFYSFAFSMTLFILE